MRRGILSTLAVAYTLYGDLVATLVRDVPEVNFSTYGEIYSGAQKRLILLDNDGTLKGPGGWSSAEKIRLDESLKKLAMNPKNSVWIVSARPVSRLKEDFGDVPNLNLAGEYGAVAYEYGKDQDIGLVHEYELAELREIILDVFKKHGEPPEFSSRGNGLKTHLITYQKNFNVQDQLNAVKNAISRRFPDIEVKNYPEEGYVNFQHKDASKGKFAAELLPNYNTKQGDFALSVGDDTPDEDMHSVMNHNGFRSVIVSTSWDSETCAKHRLSDPQHTQNLLEYLASLQ